MFCLTASACTRCSACGLKLATSRGSVPWVGSTCRSGWVSAMTRRAASSVSASRARISIWLPSRLMPPWRTSFSRSATRMSLASVSRRLVMAVRMSTCSMKCTPPRRSSPRYMGWALMAASQAGERDTRLSAMMWAGSAASGLSARSMTSLALSWVSGVSKRAHTELPSSVRRWGVRPAACSAPSTRDSVPPSIRVVALPADTCTAGASPKKLGRV